MGQLTTSVPIGFTMASQRNRSTILAILAAGVGLCALSSMSPMAWTYNLHQRNPGTTTTYWADVGYFADGTSVVRAGNAINHGEPSLPDPHMNGSPLPASKYMADVGYFVDGTSYIRAGNALNHGEPSVPDPHMNGSPMPPSKYFADVGYFVDGTDITKAGNAMNHALASSQDSCAVAG